MLPHAHARVHAPFERAEGNEGVCRVERSGGPGMSPRPVPVAAAWAGHSASPQARECASDPEAGLPFRSRISCVNLRFVTRANRYIIRYAHRDIIYGNFEAVPRAGGRGGARKNQPTLRTGLT